MDPKVVEVRGDKTMLLDGPGDSAEGWRKEGFEYGYHSEFVPGAPPARADNFLHYMEGFVEGRKMRIAQRTEYLKRERAILRGVS